MQRQRRLSSRSPSIRASRQQMIAERREMTMKQRKLSLLQPSTALRGGLNSLGISRQQMGLNVSRQSSNITPNSALSHIHREAGSKETPIKRLSNHGSAAALPKNQPRSSPTMHPQTGNRLTILGNLGSQFRKRGITITNGLNQQQPRGLRKIQTLSLIHQINMKLTMMTRQGGGGFKGDKKQRGVATNINQRNGRKAKAIQLDHKFEDRLQAYLEQFPEGSCNKLLAEFSPVPSQERLEDKFEYFYRPYNYVCNTKKFIDYSRGNLDGQVDPYELYRELIEDEHFLDTYLKSCGVSQQERSRSEPQREMQRAALVLQIEMLSQENEPVTQEGVGEAIANQFSQQIQKQRDKALAGWRKICNFFLKDDPRTNYFVLNQLRYLTGQNQIKRKRKRAFKAKAEKLLPNNKDSFHEQLYTAQVQHQVSMSKSIDGRRVGMSLPTQNSLAPSLINQRARQELREEEEPVEVDQINQDIQKEQSGSPAISVESLGLQMGRTSSAIVNLSRRITQPFSPSTGNMLTSKRTLREAKRLSLRISQTKKDSMVATDQYMPESESSVLDDESSEQGSNNLSTSLLKRNHTLKRKGSVRSGGNSDKNKGPPGRLQRSGTQKRSGFQKQMSYEQRLLSKAREVAKIEESELVQKQQEANQQASINKDVIEEVTETFESISLSALSREQDLQARRDLHLDPLPNLTPSKSSSKSSASSSDSQSKQQQSEAGYTSHMSRSVPSIVKKQKTKRHKLRMKKASQNVVTEQISDESKSSINSRMSAHERQRITQKNALRKQKRAVARTRKETQKLQVFGTNSMMNMLGKAIRQKLITFAPPGSRLFQSQRTNVVKSRSQATKRSLNSQNSAAMTPMAVNYQQSMTNMSPTELRDQPGTSKSKMSRGDLSTFGKLVDTQIANSRLSGSGAKASRGRIGSEDDSARPSSQSNSGQSMNMQRTPVSRGVPSSLSQVRNSPSKTSGKKSANLRRARFRQADTQENLKLSSVGLLEAKQNAINNCSQKRKKFFDKASATVELDLPVKNESKSNLNGSPLVPPSTITPEPKKKVQKVRRHLSSDSLLSIVHLKDASGTKAKQLASVNGSQSNIEGYGREGVDFDQKTNAKDLTGNPRRRTSDSHELKDQLVTEQEKPTKHVSDDFSKFYTHLIDAEKEQEEQAPQQAAQLEDRAEQNPDLNSKSKSCGSDSELQNALTIHVNREAIFATRQTTAIDKESALQKTEPPCRPGQTECLTRLLLKSHVRSPKLQDRSLKLAKALQKVEYQDERLTSLQAPSQVPKLKPSQLNLNKVTYIKGAPSPQVQTDTNPSEYRNGPNNRTYADEPSRNIEKMTNPLSVEVPLVHFKGNKDIINLQATQELEPNMFQRRRISSLVKRRILGHKKALLTQRYGSAKSPVDGSSALEPAIDRVEARSRATQQQLHQQLNQAESDDQQAIVTVLNLSEQPVNSAATLENTAASDATRPSIKRRKSSLMEFQQALLSQRRPKLINYLDSEWKPDLNRQSKCETTTASAAAQYASKGTIVSPSEAHRNYRVKTIRLAQQARLAASRVSEARATPSETEMTAFTSLRSPNSLTLDQITAREAFLSGQSAPGTSRAAQADAGKYSKSGGRSFFHDKRLTLQPDSGASDTRSLMASERYGATVLSPKVKNQVRQVSTRERSASARRAAAYKHDQRQNNTRRRIISPWGVPGAMTSDTRLK